MCVHLWKYDNGIRTYCNIMPNWTNGASRRRVVGCGDSVPTTCMRCAVGLATCIRALTGVWYRRCSGDAALLRSRSTITRFLPREQSGDSDRLTRPMVRSAANSPDPVGRGAGSRRRGPSGRPPAGPRRCRRPRQRPADQRGRSRAGGRSPAREFRLGAPTPPRCVRPSAVTAECIRGGDAPPWTLRRHQRRRPPRRLGGDPRSTTPSVPMPFNIR